jgi:hypothetical protein
MLEVLLEDQPAVILADKLEDKHMKNYGKTCKLNWEFS